MIVIEDGRGEGQPAGTGIGAAAARSRCGAGLRALAVLLASSFIASPALAWTPETDGRIAELEARLEAQDARIRHLESRLLQLTGGGSSEAIAAAPALPAAPSGSSASTATAASPAPGNRRPDTSESSRLRVAGDLRLRFEHNGSDEAAPDDSRAVIRARLRASYDLADWIQVGGQIATGDPDDPNSLDVTLGNFADDLDVSLDQAYVRLHRDGWNIWGGKFPQPFRRTDLVWDGDVSPQGLAASYAVPVGGGLQIRGTGLYFPIERSVGGADSNMTGGQVELQASGRAWKAALAAGYYDYRLGRLETADAGDLRSNLIGPDGRYLSDFDLLDIIADFSLNPWGERWPIGITLDWVKNLGAATSADSGYGAGLTFGRASRRGDLRLGYGYSRAETDAVFAAFSQDNIAIATNYRLHALTLDYLPRNDLMLTANLYLYRPDDPFYATRDPDDWLSRFRLNALFSF